MKRNCCVVRAHRGRTPELVQAVDYPKALGYKGSESQPLVLYENQVINLCCSMCRVWMTEVLYELLELGCRDLKMVEERLVLLELPYACNADPKWVAGFQPLNNVGSNHTIFNTNVRMAAAKSIESWWRAIRPMLAIWANGDSEDLLAIGRESV